MSREASGFAAALFLVFAPALASGQETQSPDVVPLQIVGDSPALRYEVRADRAKSSTSCTSTPCTVYLRPGRYRVSASGDGVASGKRRIDVDGPTVVDVTAGSSTGHTTGLVIGVGGASLAVIALVGLVSSDPCGIMDCSSKPRSTPSRTPWLVLGGVGLVSTLTGWIVFGSSGTSIDARSARRASPGREFALGIGPNGSGVSVGAMGSF
jgi:hypothetical protein